MLEVRDVQFTAAGPSDRKAGLLGWTRFTIGPLHLDGVAVRKTRRGELRLSFPARRDGQGTQHSLVRPVAADARLSIERQVFTALGFREDDR